MRENRAKTEQKQSRNRKDIIVRALKPSKIGCLMDNQVHKNDSSTRAQQAVRTEADNMSRTVQRTFMTLKK